MWPYGWEHVRADSIKSNTVDPMKVQTEVRAGQQGEQAEKWAPGRWAEQQARGERWARSLDVGRALVELEQPW